MIQNEKEKLIKEQSGQKGKKESYNKKEKKKVLAESESSETGSDNEGEGSEVDMKEVMGMFARSFMKGKF